MFGESSRNLLREGHCHVSFVAAQWDFRGSGSLSDLPILNVVQDASVGLAGLATTLGFVQCHNATLTCDLLINYLALKKIETRPDICTTDKLQPNPNGCKHATSNITGE